MEVDDAARRRRAAPGGGARGRVRSLARDGDEVVGGSVGMLARHHDRPALHSHITGVLAPGRGIGRAIKQHQRAWAAASSLDWVTWTFDPLVRTNAWFNLTTLGARVAAYLVDFYGPLDDDINRGDESDRLLVEWPTDPGAGGDPAVSIAGGRLRRVGTPADVVALRRDDAGAAAHWRRRVCDELGGALHRGGDVVGFTRAGDYLIRP